MGESREFGLGLRPGEQNCVTFPAVPYVFSWRRSATWYRTARRWPNPQGRGRILTTGWRPGRPRCTLANARRYGLAFAKHAGPRPRRVGSHDASRKSLASTRLPTGRTGSRGWPGSGPDLASGSAAASCRPSPPPCGRLGSAAGGRAAPRDKASGRRTPPVGLPRPAGECRGLRATASTRRALHRLPVLGWTVSGLPIAGPEEARRPGQLDWRQEDLPMTLLKPQSDGVGFYNNAALMAGACARSSRTSRHPRGATKTAGTGRSAGGGTASWAATGTTGFCWTRPRPRSLLRRTAAVAGRGAGPGAVRGRLPVRGGAPPPGEARADGRGLRPARDGALFGGGRPPARSGRRPPSWGWPGPVSAEAVQEAFHKSLLRANHPDLHGPGATARMARINAARDTLLGALGQGRRRG